jgi:hypothetical protein
MPVTSLRKTCARPPEVAICGACTCALEKQEQNNGNGNGNGNGNQIVTCD